MSQMNLLGKRLKAMGSGGRRSAAPFEPQEKPIIVNAPAQVSDETRHGEAGRIVQLKHAIIGERYLWDMRCWDRYHDEEEISEWIDNGYVPNNCGSAVYCIQELFRLGVSKKEIIDAIVRNTNKQFAHRMVKCFDNPHRCPAFRTYGNFSDCNCEQRCGKGEDGDSVG